MAHAENARKRNPWGDRLRLPVVVSPLFLSSGPELVIACSKAGIVGTFPALNQRTTEGFSEWLDQVDAALNSEDAPYGVNLIAHKTNPRLQADLEVCVEHKVPLVITSLGAAVEVVEKVHGYGGVVFHDVTTVAHARKAAESGVDGLILVTAGAGGHAGMLNPFAMVAEVRSFFEGTILLAGCLSTGRDIATARMMGADLAYMGTRFIATEEALSPDGYKQMLVDSDASEILYTPAISSIPANFLTRSIVEAGLDPQTLPTPGRVHLSHLTDPYGKHEDQTPIEAKAWRDIWSAGHGVSSIHDVLPTESLVDNLAEEYRAAAADFQTWTQQA